MKITSFLKEVELEMKKVNWPTLKEALKDTLIVISISMVAALFLGGLDIVIRELIKRIV
jgi:preprotein translocase subunit SecE